MLGKVFYKRQAQDGTNLMRTTLEEDLEAAIEYPGSSVWKEGEEREEQLNDMVAKSLKSVPGGRGLERKIL